MEHSESIKNLADALNKAQAKVGAAKMDSTNPFYQSKYSSLGSVIETIKPIAQEFGLSIAQFPISTNNSMGIKNVLMHSSGEWIAQDVLVPFTMDDKNLAQTAGKMITYLRRYSLAAIFNVYADEDIDAGGPDDMQAPSKQLSREQAAARAKQNEVKPLVRPLAPEALKSSLIRKAEQYEKDSDFKLDMRTKPVEKIVSALKEIFAGPFAEEQTSMLLDWIYEIGSEPQLLTHQQAKSLLDWLALEQDAGGAYIFSQMATKEADQAMTYIAEQDEKGQANE
jgi:hypothetical protein